MKLVYLLFLILLPLACRPNATRVQSMTELIIEETEYEGRPHFRVTTGTLSYYYDLRGGGFSRIIDQDGNDWISFRMEPWGSYPASAASAFRGLPNLVFQQDDDGAGHPGHDKCTSRIEKNKIITESLNGLWEWSWEFEDSHAVLELTNTDPERAYWFLYEGIPGGRYCPDETTFGHDSGGPHQATQDYYKGDILRGHFRWIYVGNKNTPGTLFMIQDHKDELLDMISFLGNTEAGLDSPDGMTVIGFGREKDATAMLKGNQRFIIGIYPEYIHDRDAHEKLRKYIESKFLN